MLLKITRPRQCCLALMLLSFIVWNEHTGKNIPLEFFVHDGVCLLCMIIHLLLNVFIHLF